MLCGLLLDAFCGLVRVLLCFVNVILAPESMKSLLLVVAAFERV